MSLCHEEYGIEDQTGSNIDSNLSDPSQGESPDHSIAIRSRGFTMAKAGNDDSENDDAYFIGEKNLIYAISDGATTASYSGEWARILVRNFTPEMLIALSRAEPAEAHDVDLKGLQDTWSESLPWERLNKSWYAGDIARKGGWATLLTVCLDREGDCNKWTASGVGDSCFLLIRDGNILVKGPICDADGFDTSPDLIGSAGTNSKLAKAIWSDTGDFQTGDLILIATDALSQWIYRNAENDGRPWETLREIGSDQDFKQFILDKHVEKAIKNDDTTLIIIEIGDYRCTKPALATVENKTDDTVENKTDDGEAR